jgi:hypothetical protein
MSVILPGCPFPINNFIKVSSEAIRSPVAMAFSATSDRRP